MNLDATLLVALPAYLPALLAASAVLCVALGARARLSHARLTSRLDVLVAPAFGAIQRQSDEESFRSRALAPLVMWLAQLVDSMLPDRQIERIRENLALAGYPYSRHLARFLAAKAGLAIGGAALAALLQLGEPLLQLLLLAVASAIVGFYLPGVWLGRAIARRKQAVLRALPDALDLLTVSVSAGLGLDGALVEVVQRWDNSLTKEFAAVLRDLKLGMGRRDALRAFAKRTGVEEVNHFVAAVIQADELGMPIKEVLQIQAEQIRLRRRHLAEERARKATIKMLLPMGFFIFPAMFVVILGPAAVQIFRILL